MPYFFHEIVCVLPLKTTETVADSSTLLASSLITLSLTFSPKFISAEAAVADMMHAKQR